MIDIRAGARAPGELTRSGLLARPEDEAAFVADEWGQLGARVANIGLWGGLAFLLAAATDFAVLGAGIAAGLLLTLRLAGFALGLAVFRRARAPRPTLRLGAMMLVYDALIAALFLIIVAVYGDRASVEFQAISAFLLLGVLFVYGPVLHPASLLLGAGFSLGFWLEAWLLLHAGAPVLSVLAVLLGFVVMAGWQIAVQFNRAHRLAWSDGRQLAAAGRHLRSVFEVCPVPLVLTTYDDGHVVEFNRAARELLDPQGRVSDPSTARSVDFYADAEERDLIREALRGQGDIGPLDLRMRATDGSLVDVMYSAVRVEADSGTEILASLVEITERKQREDELRRLTQTDGLTGLLNRAGLERELPEAVARARDASQALAVGFIDLDDFKPVNDAWGHAAGDRLLREFARRLQGRLRRPGLVARVGGDEFVVVIEGLDELTAHADLKAVLARLHGAVEEAFEVGTGARVEIGMTMGLALFPFDAVGADALIRQADAAMYHAKLHKVDRLSWWRIGAGGDQPERGIAFDAYGDEASALLLKARGHVEAAAADFGENFESELGALPEPAAVLASLDADEMRGLIRHQSEHMTFLLSPTTTRTAVAARASALGSIHALAGVSNAWLTRAQALYRKLLGEKLNQVLMPSRDRYQVTLIAEARLQDDIQAQLQAAQSVMESYMRFLARPLPAPGTLWIDALRAEVDALGALVGVVDAASYRPDSLGVFQLEAIAESTSEALRAVSFDPAYRPEVDPRSPLGNALVARAWRGENLVSTASYRTDPGVAHWNAVLGGLGVRSALAFPVLGEGGRPVAAVRLFGRHPNQFESAWMRQFASSLQQRCSSLWRQCRTPASDVVPPDEALAYRERLFAGGLRILVQPVVDLGSGAVVRAEALARLQMPDGRIVPPALFLPQLGTAELDRLFRFGLDAALEALRLWDEAGLALDISVNIAPSTLVDPGCARWVEQALREHGVAPTRLTLEILETQRIEAMQQDAAITRLIGLGIRLAMDDLGAGYSSLQRLASLPFATIKIDQSLVLRIRDNPKQTLSMVSTIIQMGKDFERDVVVEGLEDDAMIEAAALLGAGYGQGYGLARPMPVQDLPAWVLARQARPGVGAVTSHLGALAHLWHASHDGGRLRETLESCPLTAFLDAAGAPAAEAAALHRSIHAGVAVRASTRALIDWLADRVQSGQA